MKFPTEPCKVNSRSSLQMLNLDSASYSVPLLLEQTPT